MAWSGSSSDEMKLRSEGGSGRVLGLVSPELSPSPQDPVRSAGGSKRQHQSVRNLSFEVDDDGMIEDQSHPGKKRRLTGEQVRFLEMSFEMENKLEPERKTLIAKHLGLLPRQVAIWFQNRRARWKNKQLEQECETLKVEYTAVLQENENMIKENEALLEVNKKLQAEVARLMGLLESSDLVCMINNGSVSEVVDGGEVMAANVTTGMILCEAAESVGGDASETHNFGDDDGSLCTGKSDLTSPTKSEEVQDSGRSYPSTATPPPPCSSSSQSSLLSVSSTAAATATATTTTSTPPANTATTGTPITAFPQAPSSFEIAAISDPVKLEDPSHLFSEELVGNLVNPLIFQHLAASGVCLEDACNIVFGWEDPSPNLSWF